MKSKMSHSIFTMNNSLLSKNFSKTTKCISYSDYVYEQLYHPQKGYFTKESKNQLGKMKTSIPFGQLMGYHDYVQTLIENYPKNQFLTPSEIFRPFYGMTIGNLILKKSKNQPKKQNLKIIEIGSGLGGHASSLLSFYRNNSPSVYNQIDYTLVEISPFSIAESKKLLEIDHFGLISRGQIKFINKDIFKADLKTDAHCYIILLEILDNLTHDKVCISQSGKNSPKEAWIEIDLKSEKTKEIYKDLTNEPAKKVLQIWKELHMKNDKLDMSTFFKENNFEKLTRTFFQLFNRKKDVLINLPTGFYKIADKLTSDLPNSEFIISDFSTLPTKNGFFDSFIEINAPIISTKLTQAHETKEYSSVIEPEFGTADIFYPTDFELIEKMLLSLQSKNYSTFTPPQFFDGFADRVWAETRSGYNPMRDDFANTRFLFKE